MLGIIFIYWIGRYFYKLAEEYNKSNWGYAILGVAVYYAGTFAFGFLIGMLAEIISPGLVSSTNQMVFSLLMIPLGALAAYVLFIYLKKTWEKNKPLDEIDQIGGYNNPANFNNPSSFDNSTNLNNSSTYDSQFDFNKPSEFNKSSDFNDHFETKL